MDGKYQTLLNDYLHHACLAGHTVQGISGLKNRIPKFLTFLEEHNLTLREVGINQAQEYQGWLIETGRRDGGNYSPKTVNAYIVAAAGFCGFAKQKGLIPANPFKEIKRIRVDKKLPRNLLKEDRMEMFLEKLGRYEEEGSLKTKKTRYRVHVVAELLYATGLRISEAANLRVEDIDFTRGTVIVRQGKGGRSRTAWMNDYAKDLLKVYVEQMRDVVFSEWNEKNGSLFGVRWQPFEKMVNKVLKKTAGELGLPGVTAHGFRHAVGYHLLRAGCNIRYIQEILGHKLLRNTEIYTRVDKEDLREVLDTFHPRQFKGQP